jgi:hypothetical protein
MGTSKSQRVFRRSGELLPVAQRPHCHWCGSRLLPFYMSHWPSERPAELPDLEWCQQQVLDEHARRQLTWGAYVLRVSQTGVGYEIRYWTGRYIGELVVDGVPMFCGLHCLANFGRAAWQAGFRKKLDGPP